MKFIGEEIPPKNFTLSESSIVDAVNEINKQLLDEPAVETRNRKPLFGVTPRFEHRPPVWEIRLGGIRVFYDVYHEANEVNIRAVRRKEKGQTTEKIL